MRETINDELKVKDIDKIEKINGESLDIVKENVKKLKEIFPEVFCEDKIDFKRLEEVLGEYTDNSDERYRFEWHGKSKAIKLSQIPSKGTLRPCKEESKNWDTTENLYIEGDNLEVLKLLQKSYQGKIKMIYIDPPYNTGNDFIYSDDYSDNLENYLKITEQKDEEGNRISTNSEGGGRYHTNWLNMMYPRLRLARNLLADDGVVFISIDDNEVDNLKKICDEILGSACFIDCITWNKRVPKNDNKGIGNIHEYILVYTKSSESTRQFFMIKDGLDEVFEFLKSFKKNHVPIEEAEKQLKQLYKKRGYDRGITLYNNLDNNYEPWGKINVSWPNADTFGPCYDVLHPRTGKATKVPDRGWRWSKESFDAKLDYEHIHERHDGSFVCGDIWFAKDENTQPSSIKYLKDVSKMLLRSIISLKSDGGIEVEKLFDKKSYFSYPKPVSLMKLLISSLYENDGFFMDFFSGSSTTAHAVMQLNSEDNGKRKFIMVQLPEKCDENSEAYKAGYKNICEIGKERIRRAGDKIVEENKGKEGIEDLDIGFKVFKLDTSNIKPWNPDYDNLKMTLEDSIDNFVPGRTEEDILYEIMLKYGIDLTYPVDVKEICGKKLFSVGFGALIVCLDSDITLELVNEIIKYKNELNPKTCRVVFRDNGFKTDSVKTNAIETLHRNNIKEIMSI